MARHRIHMGHSVLKENVVLSVSMNTALLNQREAVLRAAGYRVISKSSCVCIQYEIHMGQCGILLLCYTVHDAIHHDLAGIFLQHCPKGVIVFVMHPDRSVASPHAHVSIHEAEIVEKFHAIKKSFGKSLRSA